MFLSTSRVATAIRLINRLNNAEIVFVINVWILYCYGVAATALLELLDITPEFVAILPTMCYRLMPIYLSCSLYNICSRCLSSVAKKV